MTTLILEQDPIAVNASFAADRLIVELADGRSFMLPLAWYPRLLHGTDSEQQSWQILGDGYVIEWPDLDEHIGLKGLWPVAGPVKVKPRSNAGSLRVGQPFQPDIVGGRSA